MCDGWQWFYPAELGKGFVDEDEGDEDGEDFLGEAGDEAHQEAALARHNQHHDDDQPHSHPHSAHDVLEALRLAELNGGMGVGGMGVGGSTGGERWRLGKPQKARLRDSVWGTHSEEGLFKH